MDNPSTDYHLLIDNQSTKANAVDTKTDAELATTVNSVVKETSTLYTNARRPLSDNPFMAELGVSVCQNIIERIALKLSDKEELLNGSILREKCDAFQFLYPFRHTIYYGDEDDDYIGAAGGGGAGVDDFLKLAATSKRKTAFLIQEGDGYDGRGGGINVTHEFLTFVRARWIHDMVLQGGDCEFNIFRSLCFTVLIKDCCEQVCNCLNLCGNAEKQLKVTVAYLATLLQLLLLTALTYDLWTTDSSEDLFRIDSGSAHKAFDDCLLVLIAFVVFSVFCYLTAATIANYTEFYARLSCVCQVSWAIIVLDFASNVLVGLWLCCIALFFLLSSESLTDAALNSFALTFILELDDIVNLFQKDTTYLLEQDFKYAKYNRENLRYKRQIQMNGTACMTCTEILVPFVNVITAPLRIFHVFALVVHAIYSTFWERSHRDHRSVLPANESCCEWWWKKIIG